jgi:uncharacterized membrane protein YgcG
MKTTKTLAWVVALGGLASAFLSCTQTPAACQVGLAGSGHGYAVAYTPVGTMPACATAPGFSVAQLGDIIGMESYHPATADGSTYNVHITTVALQSDTLGNEMLAYAGYMPPGNDTTMGDHAYALGTFANENPDANQQCQVDNIQPAIQKFTAVAAEPAGPMMMPPALPALPADAWEYQWSNMQVYVTAADQGVQFAADLTLTETTGANGASCAVQYHAIGLWPAVSCTDMNGNPDLDMCNPCAEPNLGRATGSGISPDALTACVQIFAQSDPRGAYYCVLAGTSDPPVLNPHPQTCEGTVMSLGNGSGGTTSSSSGAGGGGAGGSGTGGSGTGGSPGDAGTDSGDGG